MTRKAALSHVRLGIRPFAGCAAANYSEEEIFRYDLNLTGRRTFAPPGAEATGAQRERAQCE